MSCFLIFDSSNSDAQIRRLLADFPDSLGLSPTKVFYFFCLVVAHFYGAPPILVQVDRFKLATSVLFQRILADEDFLHSFLINLHQMFDWDLFALAINFFVYFVADVSILSRVLVLLASFFSFERFFGCIESKNNFIAPIYLLCRVFDAGFSESVCPKSTEIVATFLLEFSLNEPRMKSEWTCSDHDSQMLSVAFLKLPLPDSEPLSLLHQISSQKAKFNLPVMMCLAQIAIVGQSLGQMSPRRVLDYLVRLHRINPEFRHNTRILIRKLLVLKYSQPMDQVSFDIFVRLFDLGPHDDNHEFVSGIFREIESLWKETFPGFTEKFLLFAAKKFRNIIKKNSGPVNLEKQFIETLSLLFSRKCFVNSKKS